MFFSEIALSVVAPPGVRFCSAVCRIEFGVVIKTVGGALANGLKDKCDVINNCAAFMVTND